jgi:hypothetical protein
VPCSASSPNTSSPSPASEKGPDSHIRPISPISPIPSNSKLNTQNSTLPKPPLSAYERALLAGKTFLEALYIHSTSKSPKANSPRRNPGQQDKDQAAKPSPWDSFSQKVDVYSGFQSTPSINFRSALGRNTLG